MPIDRMRIKFPWQKRLGFWLVSQRIKFGLMVFCFMLLPVAIVNFKKISQYSQVQEYYLQNAYAEKSDTVWKHLWLQTQVLRQTAEALSRESAFVTRSGSMEEGRLVEQVRHDHLSFAVEVGAEGRIQKGASQYLLPSASMKRKRKLESYYAGLVPSDMVAGTGMEKGYERG